MMNKQVAILILLLLYALLANSVNATSIQGVAINTSSASLNTSSVQNILSGVPNPASLATTQASEIIGQPNSQSQDIAELKRRVDESDQKIVRLTASTQDLKDTTDQLKVNISQISNQQNAISQTSSVTQTSTSGVLPSSSQSISSSQTGGVAGVLGSNPAVTQAVTTNASNVISAVSNSTSSVANILGVPNGFSAGSIQSVGVGGSSSIAQVLPPSTAAVALATSSAGITMSSASSIAVNTVASSLPLSTVAVAPATSNAGATAGISPVVGNIASVDNINAQQKMAMYPPFGYYPPPPPGYPPYGGYYPPPPSYYPPPPGYYPQVSSGVVQTISEPKQSNGARMQPSGESQPHAPSAGYYLPPPNYYPYHYPPGYPPNTGAQQGGELPQNYYNQSPTGVSQGAFQATSSPESVKNPASTNIDVSSSTLGVTTTSAVPLSPTTTNASLVGSSIIPAPVVDKLTDLLSNKLFGTQAANSSSNTPSTVISTSAPIAVATPGQPIPAVTQANLPVGGAEMPGANVPPGLQGVMPGSGSRTPGVGGAGSSIPIGGGAPGAVPLSGSFNQGVVPSRPVSGVQQEAVRPPFITLQESLRQREILKQQVASATPSSPSPNIAGQFFN